MEDYGRSISLSHARDTSEDEEDDHTTPPLVGPSRLQIISTHRSGGSGVGGSSAGEVSDRKPRGRPPGSKNKPKPPVVVTRESDAAMKPVVLEISPGSDVIDAVVRFARRRQLGVTVLSGSGSVSNVTIRHPGSHAPSLTLHGPFNMLSLTGTFLGYSSSPPSSLSSSSCFGISLAGVQGQVFGGIVAGKVMAATQVVLVGSTFMNPSFHRLPAELEQAEEQAKPPSQGGSTAAVAMSISSYGGGVAAPTPLSSCQMSPDHVLAWGGPTSRTPPPY